MKKEDVKCIILMVKISPHILHNGEKAKLEVITSGEGQTPFEKFKAFIELVNQSPIDIVVEYGSNRKILKRNGRSILRYIFTTNVGKLTRFTFYIYPMWSEVHEKETIKLVVETGHLS